MALAEIYTTPTCGYCRAAKRFLAGKGVDVREIDVAAEPSLRGEMVARTRGRYSVPQIFIGGTHVGGFDDLIELDQDGKLTPLLAV